MARPGCETPKHPLRCHAGASLVQVGVDAGAIVPEGEAEHVGCRDVIHSLGAVPPREDSHDGDHRRPGAAFAGGE